MKIQEIMSQPARTCRMDDTLDTAASLMWEHDCGAIPVTDEGGRIVGIVTDRDICMAACIQGRTPREIPIADAMADNVVFCHPDDSLDAAERLMSEHQIRRVPVVDGDNRPVGVLSMNDIARHAALTPEKNGLRREAIRTMDAICRHRPLALAATNHGQAARV